MKSEGSEHNDSTNEFEKLEKVLDKFDKMCYNIKVRCGCNRDYGNEL